MTNMFSHHSTSEYNIKNRMIKNNGSINIQKNDDSLN